MLCYLYGLSTGDLAQSVAVLNGWRQVRRVVLEYEGRVVCGQIHAICMPCMPCGGVDPFVGSKVAWRWPESKVGGQGVGTWGGSSPPTSNFFE